MDRALRSELEPDVPVARVPERLVDPARRDPGLLAIDGRWRRDEVLDEQPLDE